MSGQEKPPRLRQPQTALHVDLQVGAGVYSNLMLISHRREEFVLDFFFVQPQGSPGGRSVATLRSRVITSPAHAKRILAALQENVRRYEATHGPIPEATDMPKLVH